jgi:hypothetical protein
MQWQFAEDGRDSEVRYLGEIDNSVPSRRRLVNLLYKIIYKGSLIFCHTVVN